MDLLADILRQAGLKRRVLHQRVWHSPEALTFPCAKSLGFHVVTQGTAYIHAAGLPEPLLLHGGDVALMARGCDHVVSTDAAPPQAPLMIGDASQPVVADAPPPLLTLVSGAYQLWNTPVHPFFDELPNWYVMRADVQEPFAAAELAIKLLAGETQRQEMGAETVSQALLDIIFTHLLRRILAQEAPEAQTWGQGLRHPQMRMALEAMHADIAADWSLDTLAKQAGLSRTGLAQKFKQTVGTSPLQYLTTLRVQKAMELLSETDDKLESVALAVGYQDAFSFSKVFKKVAGMPPKVFREQDRAQRLEPWRF